jgi:bacillolysin
MNFKACTIATLLGTLIFNIGYTQSVTSPSVKKYSSGTGGSTRLVRFDTDDSRHLITQVGDHFERHLMMTKSDELRPIKTKHSVGISGFKHEKFQQYYKGIKVEHGIFSAHSKNGRLHSISGEFYPTKNIDVFPKLNEAAALESALKNINAEEYMWESVVDENLLKKTENAPSATYYPKGEIIIINDRISRKGETALAYKFEICAKLPKSRNLIYVDAHTGEILAKDEQIRNSDYLSGADVHSGKTRYSDVQFFSASSSFPFILADPNRNLHTMDFNNTVDETKYKDAIDYQSNLNVWKNDNGSLDTHWGMTTTYDFFAEKFNWFGHDGDNGQLVAKNNWFEANSKYENGTIYLGGYSFGGFYFSLNGLSEVVHESAHAFQHSTANLTYVHESGALNEGLSDIWQACVKDYANKKFNLKKDPFLLGDETCIPGNFSRSMKDPKSVINPVPGRTNRVIGQGDPATYHGKNWMFADDKDRPGLIFHVNNGVINHWFFLLCQGGNEIDEQDPSIKHLVAGIGIENAAKIVFEAEANFFTPNTRYEDAREYTIEAARMLFGNNSAEHLSTIQAWEAVRVPGYSLQANDEYCTPGQSPKSDIGLVQIADLKQIGVAISAANYYDYTNLYTATLRTKETYPVYFKQKNQDNISRYWSLWVDLDQDNQFNQQELLLSAQNTIFGLAGHITIPDSYLNNKVTSKTKTGYTRMRLMLSTRPNSDPCVVPAGEEVEIIDYKVYIPGLCDSHGGFVGDINQDKYFISSVYGSFSGKSSVGYSNFTDVEKYGIAKTLIPGDEVEMSVVAGYQTFAVSADKAPVEDGGGGGGGSGPAYMPYDGGFVVAWIDFNGDGSFSGAEKIIEQRANVDGANGGLLASFSGGNNVTKNVPKDAKLGPAIMRVSFQHVPNWSESGEPMPAFQGPCDNFLEGEVEDHTVIISNDATARIRNNSPSSSLNNELPELEPGVVIYPNPVSELLKMSGNTKDVTISIVNISGEVIYKGRAVDQMDISHWSSGLYLATMSNGQRIRFIKK